LPGAYRLHLPSDALTIWYTVTENQDGQIVIVVQYLKGRRSVRGRTKAEVRDKLRGLKEDIFRQRARARGLYGAAGGRRLAGGTA
jgi:hypothetical protein